MPNFGENTRNFLQFPIYYYDVVYSQSLPVRGYAGCASVLVNAWDPIAVAPALLNVDAAGALKISGTISAATSATATAAAPTYVEGTSNALSMDLAGNLRTSGGAAAGLTDAQLRATPVPVSGTVATGALTDTQLRVTPVPVSGTFYPATQPISGTVSITGGVVVADSNLDVALSTRTKPADQQHVIIDSSASLVVTGAFFQTTQPVSLADLPLSVSDNAQRIANMLSLKSLLLAQAGPNGFVPVEIPQFLVG